MDTLQIWPACSSHRTNITPLMAVNDIKIGISAVPSELVRVSHNGQSLLVLVQGSQITLVNEYCGPLVVEQRKTHTPVKISGLISESFEIRKILKL